jgi:hypothetical protein
VTWHVGRNGEVFRSERVRANALRMETRDATANY